MQIKSDLDNSEKRLVRMANAYGDMHLADQAYKQYCQCSNEGINYCLLLAMVTCYCRPFTMNEGLGGLYSDYATFPDFSDNKLNEGHFFFIALRNQFFAHSSIAGIKIQKLKCHSIGGMLIWRNDFSITPNIVCTLLMRTP